MNHDVSWAAQHPGYWLFGLPVLAGGLAWLGWCLWQRQTSAAWRRAVVGGALGLMTVVFAALAAAVWRTDGHLALDQALAQGFAQQLDGVWLAPLAAFTFLGDRYWLFWIAVLLIGWQAWRRHWQTAAAAVMATAGGGALNWVLKHIFQRIRPVHDHGYLEATGYSFPSGHASASLLVYGFGCYVLLRVLPKAWHGPCVALCVSLVMAIGASRVLLQAHYFSDVVAGFAVSALWLALCMACAGPARPTHRAA